MSGAARRSHGRVEEAIRDLAELRSRDPAALPAVHAIALTRLTLESFWLDQSSGPGTDA